MRNAALYDIHGNRPALVAAHRDVREVSVDPVVVGRGRPPRSHAGETPAALKHLERPVRFIRGHGAREALAAREGAMSKTIPEPFHEVMRWTAEQLSDDHARWPQTLTLDVPDLSVVLFCHTPRSDAERFTRLAPEDRLRAVFEPVDAAVVVCGHTHIPLDRRVGKVCVGNVGSVGMPFGKPGARRVTRGGPSPGGSVRHEKRAASALGSDDARALRAKRLALTTS